MPISPFKFLDSYTKGDRELFFGREKEIEEIYARIFQSNLLLVYGASGTGKTSLIQCGLSSKFNDSDWLPLIIRRGNNILTSISAAIANVALTPIKEKKQTPSALGRVGEGLSSLYLDHFKPIYLIFDQFEELFIFGNRDEINSFIAEIAALAKSTLQCKLIFVIRGEYLEHLTAFEEKIPGFFENRIRIEKMTRKNATEAILGPCRVSGIEVEDGFAEKLLDKLATGKPDVELTYLQVFLDKVYKITAPPTPLPPEGGVSKSPSGLSRPMRGDFPPKADPPLAEGVSGVGLKFTNNLLDTLGHIGDILSAFLDEQIALIPDTDNALAVLKAFVSTEGTKRQIDMDEINEFTRTLGKDLQRGMLENFVHQFVNLRILREKDEQGKYELRHDSLAAKIYEKITLAEKELLEVRQMIASRHREYETRGTLLNDDDLRYIAPYEKKLFFRGSAAEFIDKSRHVISSSRRLKRRVAAMSLVSLTLLIAAVAYWSYQRYLNSRSNELAAMALIKVNEDPTLAYLLAEEAYKTNPKCNLAVKALIQAYANGPFYTTITGNEYAVSPDGKFLVTATNNDSTVRIYDIGGDLLKSVKEKYYFNLLADGFFPDGKNFLTLSRTRNNEIIKMRDLEGNEINSFLWKDRDPSTASIKMFSNDNRFFLLSDSREIKIFDRNLKYLFSIRNWGIPMFSMFSPDSKYILSYAGNTIKVFNIAGKPLKSWNTSNIILNAIFSKDSKYLFVTSPLFNNQSDTAQRRTVPAVANVILKSGNELSVWDTNWSRLGGYHFNNDFALSDDSKYFLTMDDTLLTVWTIEGKKYSEIKRNDMRGYNAKFFRHGIMLISQNEFTDAYSMSGKYIGRVIGDLASSSLDEQFGAMVNDNDNTVTIYHEDATEMARLTGGNESIYDSYVKFSPGNKFVITAGNSDIIRIWKPDLQNIGGITNAVFSNDGTMILGISRKTLKFYDHHGNLKRKMGNDDNTRYVAGKLSPDNRYAAVFDRKEFLHIWDVQKEKELFSLHFLESYGRTYSFSNDSKYLAVVKNYQPVIFNLAKLSAGTEGLKLPGHTGQVYSVDFSPKSNFLATASQDCTVIIWKIDSTGNSPVKFRTIRGHKAQVNSAKFSQNSKYVLTASDDSTVRIWNLNGEQVFGINTPNSGYQEPKEKRMRFLYAGFSKNSKCLEVWKYVIGTGYERDMFTSEIITTNVVKIKANVWKYSGDYGVPVFSEDKKMEMDDFLEISPDGEMIILKALNYADLLLPWRQRIAFTGENFKFSPDGKYILTLNKERLRLFPVVSEEVIRLVREEKVYGNIREMTEEEREEYGFK